MIENLLKIKGGNSCTKKASTLNKLIYFLNEQVLFDAVFSSMILLVFVITTSKFKIFQIFLTYDL